MATIVLLKLVHLLSHLPSPLSPLQVFYTNIIAVVSKSPLAPFLPPLAPTDFTLLSVQPSTLRMYITPDFPEQRPVFQVFLLFPSPLSHNSLTILSLSLSLSPSDLFLPSPLSSLLPRPSHHILSLSPISSLSPLSSLPGQRNPTPFNTSKVVKKDTSQVSASQMVSILSLTSVYIFMPFSLASPLSFPSPLSPSPSPLSPLPSPLSPLCLYA